MFYFKMTPLITHIRYNFINFIRAITDKKYYDNSGMLVLLQI